MVTETGWTASERDTFLAPTGFRTKISRPSWPQLIHYTDWAILSTISKEMSGKNYVFAIT